MPIPKPVYNPPFNVTRASHSVVTVKDLAKSRAFYVDLLGSSSATRTRTRSISAASRRPATTAWCSSARAASRHAERVGMRVFTEEDLEKAKAISTSAACRRNGSRCRTRDVPCTSPTRRRADRILRHHGREAAPDRRFEHHKGAMPQRLDHFQLLVPDVQKACEFWMSLGFRLSEYISPDGKDELLVVFLQRKGNPHDIVFAGGAGPRLHHAAFGIRTYHFSRLRPRRHDGLRRQGRDGPGRHGPATPCSSICAIPTATDRAVQHALPGDGHRERAGALGSS